MKSQPPSFGKSHPESQFKAEVSQGKSRPPVLTEQSFQVENRASTKQGPPSFSKKSDQATGSGRTSGSKRPPELPSFVENSKAKITEGPSTSKKPHQLGNTELRSVPNGVDFDAATRRDGHPTASPLSQPTASILVRPGSVVGIEKPEPLKRGNLSPLDAQPSVEESVDLTESPTQFESPQTPQNSLEGIPEASDKSGSTCPKCEALLRPGVKICVACGLDLAYDEGKTKPEVRSPFPALQRLLAAKPVAEGTGSQEALRLAATPIPKAVGLSAIEDEPQKVGGEPPVKVAPAALVIKGVTTSLSSEVAPAREGRKPIPEPLGSQIKSKLWETPVTEVVIEPLKAPTTAQIKQVGTEALQKPTSDKSKPKRNVALVAGIALAVVVGAGVAAWLWVSRPSSTAVLPYAAPAAQVPISAPEVAPSTVPAPAPAPVDLPPAAKPAEPAPSPIPAPVAPVAKPEPKVHPTKSEPKPEPVAKPSVKPPPANTAPRKELSERDKQLLDKANKTLDDLLK